MMSIKSLIINTITMISMTKIMIKTTMITIIIMTTTMIKLMTITMITQISINPKSLSMEKHKTKDNFNQRKTRKNSRKNLLMTKTKKESTKSKTTIIPILIYLLI